MRRRLLVPIIACATVLAACAAPGERATGGVENRGVGNERWWDELPLPEWRAFQQVPTDDEWFEVYRLEDGLFAIYEPGQFELVISYLIVGDERALLFDTGLGIGNIRQLVESLTDLEILVLNSHSHYDHVGDNYRFEDVLGLDNAYSRASSLGRSRAELAEFIGPGWVWKDFPAGFSAGEYVGRPYAITGLVRDGERIDLGGRVLEVIETPGHAPDALCLLDRERRQLFTGDTFYLAPLYAHLPGSDADTYARTAERLAALRPHVDTLVTAHNVPFADAAYLDQLHDAFTRIAAGTGDYVLTDGAREYDFGAFSIIVPDSYPTSTPSEAIQ